MATDPELVAGFVAVKVFSAGYEQRNGVLLQSGRALRRISKLFGSELRSTFALPQTADLGPTRGFSAEDIRSYLHLMTGSYTNDQVEATLAVGFYSRKDARWRFAFVEKP